VYVFSRVLRVACRVSRVACRVSNGACLASCLQSSDLKRVSGVT